MIHLCDSCIFQDECGGELARYPIQDCANFDDGYDGPEYPDGDAYREYRMAELFTPLGEIYESTCPPD